MNASLGEIKFLSKENRRDALYIISTIAVFGLIIVFFIWSMRYVLSAVDAVFEIGEKDNVSFEILSFDFVEFAKISSRLGIVFPSNDVSRIESPVVETPPVAEASNIATSTNVAISTQEINVSELFVQILNGTVIKGLADSWKKKFVAAGFAEANIKIGNAEKRDYSGIVVRHNSSEQVLSKINSVLSQSNLQIKSEKDEKLSNVSFIIIVGK